VSAAPLYNLSRALDGRVFCARGGSARLAVVFRAREQFGTFGCAPAAQRQAASNDRRTPRILDALSACGGNQTRAVIFFGMLGAPSFCGFAFTGFRGQTSDLLRIWISDLAHSRSYQLDICPQRGWALPLGQRHNGRNRPHPPRLRREHRWTFGAPRSNESLLPDVNLNVRPYFDLSHPSGALWKDRSRYKISAETNQSLRTSSRRARSPRSPSHPDGGWPAMHRRPACSPRASRHSQQDETCRRDSPCLLRAPNW
jgi:hypothetical protein